MTTHDATSREVNGEALMTFWRKTLQDLPVLNLPFDRPRSPIQSFVRSKETLVVDDVSEAAEHVGTPLLEFLCTAVAVLLFRYTGQSDLVLGSVSATDKPGGPARIIPLRFAVDGDPKCSELTDRIAMVIVSRRR